MSGKNKILQEIHPLHLIREVQKRPALYVRNNPEMANNHFRQQIWSEVAQKLFPDWDMLSEQTKEIKVTGLMKKWRNLRDTFKRQIEIQKKIRAGHAIKKRVYIYYKHMSFLLPHFQEEEKDVTVSESEDISEPKYFENRADLPEPKRCYKRKNIMTPQHDAASFTNSVFVEEIDEDKHFLLSLIPSFKRMSEDEKLTAKMEILKVIKTVKSSSLCGVDRISFHEVDSLTSDANLTGVKIESEELCQTDEDLVQETDPDSNIDSE